MKIGLITHIADPDGAVPIILSKLVFDNVTTFSCEKSEVDDILKQLLKNDYDKIYIVDLNISEEMAKYINDDEKLKEIIEVYDHHQSEEYLNKYPFINVVVEKGGIKECGTTLYYKHLKEITKNEVLNKESLSIMVELVRQNDTFDFTNELKEDALMFRNLYDIYGRERYIEHFYNFVLENDSFGFNETERTLIELEKEIVRRYIDEKMQHVKNANIDGIPVGIVFDRAVSYRADKDEIDTTILSIKNGGGGHKHASGSPLPKDLQEKITEYIFENVEWEEICK